MTRGFVVKAAVAAGVAVAAFVIAWALWPSPAATPRARQYLDVSACLFTGPSGIAGWVAGNGSTWTVPKPLTWGATYSWQVAVSDASLPPSLTSTSATWTTPTSFVVGNAQSAVRNRLGNVDQADDGNPVMTSNLGASGYSGSGKTVDPKTANVTQQATDASVATAGPSLSIARTYNSLDPRTSQAFGAGWSSPEDMSMVPDPDGTGALILTLADGQQVRFAKNASYVYANGNLIKVTDVLSSVTWYGYDASNRATTVTDPDGYTTYTTHDSYNNVTSTTTCAAINDCQTSYTSYYENLSSPLDPRNNKPTDERGARSSSPYDPTYDTVTAFTASAQVASRTTPPTLVCPSGCKTAYTYTTGSEAATGGGTEPPGLLASITSPGGGITTYAYNSAGDVAKVTDPIGMVTTYTYDNLGRESSQTQTSDTEGYTGNPSNPIPAENLVENSRSYDPAGHLASDTNVKGTTTGYTYYGNGHLASSYVVGTTYQNDEAHSAIAVKDRAPASTAQIARPRITASR